jgi:hypothetical protein
MTEESGKLVSQSPASIVPVRGSWVASWFVFAALSSSATLLIGGIWLSFIFIFDPGKISWVNQHLPQWAQLPDQNQQPQTLAQIRSSLNKQSQSAGEPIPVENDVILLPILKQRDSCNSDCEHIVELRLYQPAQFPPKGITEKTYQLASELPISDPEESFVIAPLVNNDSDSAGSSTPLPVTEVQKYEGKTPAPGIWFYLKGQRQQGSNAIAYGYILHYNSEHTHLELLSPWTSTTGKIPQWRQLANKTPLLVVDQTVGLEPQLRVYQVKAVKLFLNTVELTPITLTEPALKDSAYQQALSIARSGLWTPANKWLQFIKQQHGKIPEAEAQIELIRLHSQLTQAQADKSWASPGQQVLADLIDGRWEKAIEVFTASPENTQEVVPLLKADSGRLWHRVEAALKVKPDRLEVKAWGALILSAQQGEAKAKSWVEERKTTPENMTYIQTLLKRLDGQYTAKNTQTNATSHDQRIVGSVQPIAKVNQTEWLPLDPKETQLASKQQDHQWYTVQVAAFHDGKSWLYDPFPQLNLPKTDPAKFLSQQLGLQSEAKIEIVVWQADGQQETTTATIKAMQLRGGILRLLAATTTALPPTQSNSRPTLALTSGAIQWVQPSPITLASLTAQQLEFVKILLPNLWRELQKSGRLPTGAIPSFQMLQQQLGHWPAQTIDFTGNGQPETALTISDEAIAALAPATTTKSQKSRPQTVIFNSDGKVIYSDFRKSTGEVLSAIATLTEQQLPVLLIEAGKSYHLKRWSVKAQRFE